MLKLAEGLSLPIDTVTQSMAILARRGAGKTYTGSVLVEEVIKAGVPVVVLDPTGAWWGLRSSADGKKPGLPVTIFGGDHADMALESTAGALFSEVVLDHPGAYIFDFSAFVSKTAEQTFAAAFLEHLYRHKKPETGPLLVVIDEADMFAPQRPGPEQTKSLGALESIVRRGRIKGMGDLLITQRAAVLNKNVLTQTEILIAMQTTGPQDRLAIKDWVENTGQDPNDVHDALASLPSLDTGEAWIWSPSFLKMLKRVRIRKRTTFDSGKTPGAGEARVVPTAFAKVDLDKLGERVAAVIRTQAENDPRALKRRIIELERESRGPLTEPAPVVKTVEVQVEVPVLTAEETKLVQSLIETLREAGPMLADALSHATSPVQKMMRMAPMAPPKSIVPPPELRVIDAKSDILLTKAERSFLSTLAQFPDGRTKAQAAFLAGYSPTVSTTRNTLSALRTKGYISGTGVGDLLRATPAGLAALGPWDPAPTGEALIQWWYGKLGLAERSFLKALVDAYPHRLDKEQAAAAAGYDPNVSTTRNTLSRLRSLGLIEGGSGSMTVSPDLAG